MLLPTIARKWMAEAVTINKNGQVLSEACCTPPACVTTYRHLAELDFLLIKLAILGGAPDNKF